MWINASRDRPTKFWLNAWWFSPLIAAPRIEALFRAHGPLIRDDFEEAAKDRDVRAAMLNKHIARRLEALRDLIGK